MSQIILRVYDGKSKTYNKKEKLKGDGFKFYKKSYGKSYWEKKFPKDSTIDDELKNKESELRKQGFKIVILQPENIRSSDYRKVFFEKNKGFFNGHYFCAYCGKIYNEKSITVDHIFPIDKTSKSKIYKYMLSKFDINNINDIRNLTPACKSCNSKKGSKTGLWLIRGALGKYNMVWASIWIMLIISIVYLIFRYG